MVLSSDRIEGAVILLGYVKNAGLTRGSTQENPDSIGWM